MKTARYAGSIAVGVVVTVAVLFTMQALIATAKAELDESGTRHFVDFVRVEQEETIQKKERKARKPTKPDTPPPNAPQPRVDSVEPVDVSVDMVAVPAQTDVSVSKLGLSSTDGEYLPIVKIAPVYPWDALNSGIEGHCLVEYTVTAAGTVTDVRVIEAEPKGVFDQTSIDAALKFKYKPRVVAGEAIAVHGVQNLFTYKLEQ